MDASMRRSRKKTIVFHSDRESETGVESLPLSRPKEETLASNLATLKERL